MKKYFQICTLTQEKSYFLVSDLKTIISYKKTQKNLLVKLCLSLIFIPLDPDPRTQMNTGLTSLFLILSRFRSIAVKDL